MAMFQIGRRPLLGGLVSAFGTSALAGPARAETAGPAIVPLEGHLPALKFRMTDVETGRPVTEAAFRGHPVILYFGFTRCPDTCPLTMQNAQHLVSTMGAAGQQLRILFVTIDLTYDTAPRLKAFLAKFGKPPVFTGLRGTPAELKAAAHRFAVYYKAPSGPDSPDPESAIRHSSATYLFGPDGTALALLPAFPTSKPDLPAVAAFIRKTMKAS